MLLRNGKNYDDDNDEIVLEESFYNDESSPWHLYYDENHNYYIFENGEYPEFDDEDNYYTIFSRNFKTKKECRDFAYRKYKTLINKNKKFKIDFRKQRIINKKK